jgi:SAM-dependent methyltransferase
VSGKWPQPAIWLAGIFFIKTAMSTAALPPMETASFYDELAAHYHLLYGDWEHAISTQGKALAALLAQEGLPPHAKVLDAACGIGTQTLGLLDHAFDVVASDISSGAVTRFKEELAKRALSATAQVDDLRTLSLVPSASVDAVIACDNSIPHLLTDSEILQAFKSCFRCLRSGGIFIISVRDYAAIERKTPDVRPHGMHLDPQGNRFLAVQVWEWEGDCYDVRMYLTSEANDGSCATKILKMRYYAVATTRLMELMLQAGFSRVSRRDGVLFQPVIIGFNDLCFHKAPFNNGERRQPAKHQS